MVIQAKGRLGDRLIAKGLLTQSQLEVALSEQRRAYRPLGEILVSLAFVRPEDVALLLAEDLGLAFVRASEVKPDPVLLAAVDRDFVHSTGSFPVRLQDGVLVIAMVDPADPAKLSAVRGRFPYPLQAEVTTEDQLLALIRQHLPEGEGQVRELIEVLSSSGADFPVERVTQALLLDGVHKSATDIHVEPEEKVTRVRYRLDGILCPGENLPREHTEAIVSRLKILAHLDIAERRRPQDGRIRMEADGRHIDLRASFMPTADGENVVLRILDRSGAKLKLPELGLYPETVKRLAQIAERPHGLFLVTGPTGSGKTTTLYALLSSVDTMRRNVATIEDPIEYRLPLVRQSQVDPSIGYGFQQGLRALLRQDPDVILVGEIRDRETAEMAIKASMTGHLVLSTLHTNSALGAIPRLSDLGVDPFLVEDTLIGVLAQRLLRRNCRACAEPAEATPEELRWLDGDAGRMARGKGCGRCGASGFSGRTSITEVFLPDDEMAAVLRSGAQLVELRRLAYLAGFRDMTADGKDKVRQGQTTIAEVERVNKSHRLSKAELEQP